MLANEIKVKIMTESRKLKNLNLFSDSFLKPKEIIFVKFDMAYEI